MTIPISTAIDLRLERHGALDIFSLEFGPDHGARFCVTSRRGGVSFGRNDLNLSFNTGDEKAAVNENRNRLYAALDIPALGPAALAQVHSAELMVLADDTPLPLSPPPRADGIITARRDLWCRISIGDCQPLALYDPRRGALAMLHAGWAGTAARIPAAAVARMRAEFASNPADIYAVLGPCVRATAYQVDERVFTAFAGNWKNWERFVGDRRDGKGYLDLAAANRAALEDAGVPEAQIIDTGLCTHTLKSLFFSHRRDGLPGGRMFALGMLKPR